MYTFVLCVLFVELILETGVGLESYIVQGLSFKNVVIYGLFALLLVLGKTKGKLPPPVRKIRMIFTITIVYSFLALIATAYLYQRTVFLLPNLISLKNTLLDSLLCFLIFYHLCVRSVQPVAMMRFLAVIIGVVSAIGVFDAIVPTVSIFGFDESDVTRIRGPFGETNQTAAVLSLYLPFVASLAVVDRKRRFMFLAVCIAVLGAIIATSSRGGTVAVAAGGLSFMWLVRKELSIGTKFLVILSAIIALICAWLILPPEYGDMIVGRFLLIFDEDVDFRTATAGRSMLFEIGWQLWLASPIIGHGWASFHNLVGSATHNVYLEYLVNLGLIGFVLLTLLWYRILKYFLETKPYCVSRSQVIIVSGISAGIIGLLVAILFVNLFKPWLFVWSFVGLGAAYATRIRAHKTKRLASLASDTHKFDYSPEPVEG